MPTATVATVVPAASFTVKLVEEAGRLLNRIVSPGPASVASGSVIDRELAEVTSRMRAAGYSGASLSSGHSSVMFAALRATAR